MHIRHVLRSLTVLLVAVTILGTQPAVAQDTNQIQLCSYNRGLEIERTETLSDMVDWGLVTVDENGNVSPTGAYSGFYLGPCTGAMTTERPLQLLNYPDDIITACDNGTTVTGTAADLQLGDVIVTMLSRTPPFWWIGYALVWEQARDGVIPGPCQTVEEPGNGNGNGGEEPGNGNGNGAEEPGNGNGNEESGNGNGNGGGEMPGNGDGDGEGVETPTQAPNAFTLTLAQRMCTDQSFSATWTGANITSIEFALSNSSDDWTSGWLSADPAAGTINADIDHHGYDKAVARVTFADGTTQDEVVDMSICVSEPTSPPITEQPTPPSKPAEVTSLPKTGSGEMVSVSVAGIIAMTASLVAIAGGMVVRRQRG